jgi:hypothetical protein
MLADGLGARLAADQAVMTLLERPLLVGLLFWLGHGILLSCLHKKLSKLDAMNFFVGWAQKSVIEKDLE